MPELDGATGWVNGTAKRSELIRKPTLIHFWAISCQVCHDNMPTVVQWRDEYPELQVVGVHMPRQQEDTDIVKVNADIEKLAITEPCAIDNEHTIGERFENQFWPAYFLFDADGNLRGRAAGYSGLKMIEGPLKRVLGIPV